MQDIATAPQATELAPQPTSKAKQKRISKRVRQAIDLIATGAVTTQRAAAQRVGISETHLSRVLKQPHGRAFLTQKARGIITVAQIRAATRLAELIDAESEHVSLQASTHTLRIEGIAPPEAGHSVTINNSITPGYVINLSPRAEPEPKVIEHDAVQHGETGGKPGDGAGIPDVVNAAAHSFHNPSDQTQDADK